jgi:hypothetical protein
LSFSIVVRLSLLFLFLLPLGPITMIENHKN